MNIELKNYFVAFIDILGFKDMVKHDSESPDKNYKYVEKLFLAHRDAKTICSNHSTIETYQFSDSIVISMPFDAKEFISFCETVKKYQFSLFKNNILCRGGVSIGKHFSDESFIFSEGLIDAYYLESQKAITPRIIISNDLIDLIYLNKSEIPEAVILTENDSTYFINYLKNEDPVLISNELDKIIGSRLNENTSVRQKQLWLLEYYNFCFPEHKKKQLLEILKSQLKKLADFT